MLDLLHISLVSLVAFAATNVDNFWLLAALHARADRALGVNVGFVIATLAVSAIAWLGSTGLEQIPPRWIDYLGIVPIAMGIARARDLLRPDDAADPARAAPLGPASAGTAFALTLSQSADNLAVFASLYADCRRSLEPAIFGTIGLCALALCGLTRWLASHPRLQGPLRRMARRLLPVLLIAVGCHVLLDAWTDEPALSAPSAERAEPAPPPAPGPP